MSDATLEQYLDTVRRELALLKGTSTQDELGERSLPVGEGRGLLVPVCELHAADDRLISTLASWRAENSSAFATRFPVTSEGTRKWLRSQVLDADDRILFLVHDREGRPIGHVGLTNTLNEPRSMEIDNVLRGEPSEPGLMSDALEALCRWAEDTFQPSRLYLRVLSDNEHAIDFYRRLGWTDDELQPLVSEVDGPRETLRHAREGEEADAWYLRMVYAPDPDRGEDTVWGRSKGSG
jgi:perosamine synthetase